jgi:hypothetical protein
VGAGQDRHCPRQVLGPYGRVGPRQVLGPYGRVGPRQVLGPYGRVGYINGVIARVLFRLLTLQGLV